MNFFLFVVAHLACTFYALAIPKNTLKRNMFIEAEGGLN